MNSITAHTTQAIQAAAAGDWEQAKALNELVLQEAPNDISTLNRLGFCALQLGKMKEAKSWYEKVLELEKFNSIALKYLQLIKAKIHPRVQSLDMIQNFIEEPGKTKSVSLLKLADPAILQSLPIAHPCTLVVKKHRVDVITQKEKHYIGCLPDDIAFRLQKMIAAGNTYTASIQSTSKKTCIVFIKETSRTPASPFATAFPVGNRTNTQGEIILDETPLDIRETGDEVDAPEMMDDLEAASE